MAVGLQCFNKGVDLLDGIRTIRRQFTDFFGDNAEAPALLAYPRRFNGGVKTQQVCLGGDLLY